jgi:outer membrane protein OmpA-like peptidoglycan-associated protein
MRKIFLSSLIALSVSGLAFAGTYLPKPLPQHQVKQVKYHYNCNWPYYPEIWYGRQILRTHFHVKSFAYPYTLRIVFPDYVLFHSGSNNFKRSANAPLQVLLEMLNYLPGAHINVVGYSNNIASPVTRKNRSMLRAQKLAGYLWENGYPAKSQTGNYRGAGASNPLESNRYVQGMTVNQRVELIINLPR